MTLNRIGVNEVLTQSKAIQRIKQLKLKGRIGKSWSSSYAQTKSSRHL
jgi:hypothetical protein